MRLYFTDTSPFVRKVRVLAHELGLADRIENVLLRPSPLATDAELSKANPLSKIPALVTDDGEVLYDSPVICEYLDGLAPEARRLVPAAGVERRRVQRLQALADGILESGILVFYERTFRPREMHWEPWLAGQTAKVVQGLDALEAEAPRFGAAVDLAQIAAAVTIAWLEFRQVLPDVRGSRAALDRWYTAFEARPSMQATRPA